MTSIYHNYQDPLFLSRMDWGGGMVCVPPPPPGHAHDCTLHRFARCLRSTTRLENDTFDCYEMDIIYQHG